MSKDAIVDAAVAILRAEGLPAVSMRRVAAELDTVAGSIYVYVDGRDGLLHAMFDRVIATINLQAPDASRWRAQLHSLLGRMRGALIDHPGIAAAAMVDPPRTQAVLRLLENLLGTLLAGGFTPQDAAWTADILSAQVTYSAIEAELRQTSSDALVKEITSTFAGLPVEEFPLITAHTAELVAGDVELRFRFAVDAVIDGVLARAASESRRPPRARRKRVEPTASPRHVT